MVKVVTFFIRLAKKFIQVFPCDVTGKSEKHFWPTQSYAWRRKWQPTPVFLPVESQGQESLVGFRLWGPTESDTTEAMISCLSNIDSPLFFSKNLDFIQGNNSPK